MNRNRPRPAKTRNRRIFDAAGHAWPVTAHRCRICRWPLADALTAAGIWTHPTCESARG